MKCSCGHLNPVGTYLCESCGKPSDDVDIETVVKEMRYEGKARRSRSRSSSLFNQMWKFFSSVKVAIYLIVVTLIAAGIGTALPQEKFIPSSSPKMYYAKEYGFWGEIYYKLGLSDMYDSWWFILLLGMIGTSLIVCSLDRVIPLYRALGNQRVTKDITFIEKQRISLSKEASSDILHVLSEKMRNKSYHVRVEKDALLAEKGRISRWGPYINHIGLIIFLVGLLCSYIPGWYLDESMWVREGELKQVPQTPYYIKNKKAFVEFHPNSATVKKYQTDAVLYKKNDTGRLVPVHTHSIQVNHPLSYGDLNLYQADFKAGEVSAITLKIGKENKDLGQFTVDLDQVVPSQIYSAGKNIDVRVLEYYPDFAFDEKKKRPISRSTQPNRPAFILEVNEKGKTERSWVIAGEKFSVLNPNNAYLIKLGNLHVTNRTGLMVRIDKRLPILLWGGIITMIGLVLGFYWQHRRIWVRVQNDILYLGAHTNKNWFGLQTELEQVVSPGWTIASMKE